ncbi:hypothetical protein NQ176_g9936 [Zarea fungicola]|uniref:Uncharacterized protein n=1 Tax=Zarea fungicola TaxID=93591 RepID=A0ACC1MIN9_9HYPO|nr:hypothetical protein NQ176_g9936 [Lecanicillium fungicola]
MGAAAANPRKKVTINTLRAQHKKGDPITVLTAHDFPSAIVADHAGMDIILVGDSLAMVAMGMEDTSEILVEEMLLHCRSVARATQAAFTVSVPTIYFSTPFCFCFFSLEIKEKEAKDSILGGILFISLICF